MADWLNRAYFCFMFVIIAAMLAAHAGLGTVRTLPPGTYIGVDMRGCVPVRTPDAVNLFYCPERKS